MATDSKARQGTIRVITASAKNVRAPVRKAAGADYEPQWGQKRRFGLVTRRSSSFPGAQARLGRHCGFRA